MGEVARSALGRVQVREEEEEEASDREAARQQHGLEDNRRREVHLHWHLMEEEAAAGAHRSLSVVRW
jgi:hypothetical protein